MHVEALSRFHTALQDGGPPPGVIATDPAESARRFAVYRNNVAVSLSEALARRYPVIQQLVGKEFFRALAAAYRAVDPPHQPVLAEWGGQFAAFLAGFAPLADWPYMADVARIEHARGLACHAADIPPLAPADLIGADPLRLVLHLHPALRMLRLDHPAVAIWAQHQPGARPAPLPPGPQIALILRERSFAVPVEVIGPGDARLIEALMARKPLAEAAEAAARAEPGRDPQPCLVRLMQSGSLVKSEKPCVPR